MGRELQAGCEALGAAAVAIAGTIDNPSGLVRAWPTTGFSDFDITAGLAELLDRPVAMVNDVNAAALGEAAAAGVEDLGAVFVGTGVGTGFVTGGQLVAGHRGMAGEGGHVIFRPGGEPCPAGCAGCYEAYLGGDALGRRAAARGLPVQTAALLEAWRAGDAGAGALMADALASLAGLVSCMVTLFDPQQIVVGGGIGSRCPEMLEAAREAVRVLPLGHGRRDLSVEPARLGDDAGLAGAALLALSLRSA